MNICNMNVTKRDGKIELVSFDKITKRINAQCNNLSVNATEIAMKVISQIKNLITTTELDEHTASICSSLITTNLDYGKLADRIIISNNHKNTSDIFSKKANILYNYKNHHGIHCPLITKELLDFIELHKDEINKRIDYTRDYNFDYFGFKTLEKNYLFKINGKVIERIQDMLMRVSLALHMDNLDNGLKSYDYMSNKYFIHATPTLFNAGTNRPQLLSCFLLGLDDSIDSIFKVISDCAKISKNSGGIGVDIDKIRSKNSYIRGTNGRSNGIIPFLKVFNETAKAVNQGGKRNGSIAVYIQPHHPDILEFLELRKNHGNEDERTRDLFLALWCSDLFMERVQSNSIWSLFNPDDCQELSDLYGDEYKKRYVEYESENKFIKQLPAREIWTSIITSQIETGTPYILQKDHINRKSNQSNIGVIKSSNLCAEIVEYSSSEEYACCTLGSLGLPKFVKTNMDEKKLVIYSKDDCINCNLVKTLCKKYNLDFESVLINDKSKRTKLYMDIDKIHDVVVDSMPQIFIKNADSENNGNNDNNENNKNNDEYNLETMEYIGGFNELKENISVYFDFERLIEATKALVNNLNKVIDLNYYPVPETELSNKNHRPLGLGVQGLADVFIKMNMPFDSDDARKLNVEIFETIYYGALIESNELAIKDGVYSTFKGSPLSEGKFQFDLWNVKPTDKYNWEELKNKIMKDGVRNSLLVALMPTASTSQILGNNECFEPYTNNIYNRRTLAGDFRIINKHLVLDLELLNLWNDEMKDLIIHHNGSIQNIEIIPIEIRNLYKTAWEIEQKKLIQLSIDRGPYVDQTQSMNLFFEEPSPNDLTKALFFGWKNGLKTCSYYMRTQSKAEAQKFTIDPNKIKQIEEKYGSVCEGCSG
jgi:ribonucleoside-diphosphate reductase alpha subunit